LSNKYLFIFVVLLILNACGLGEQGVDIPENRPNGIVQGKVLGGLYSGGTVSVYTLNDIDKRQFLASTTVQENGDFVLEFASQTQPVLIEVRGGSYLDPSSLQIIKTEPDFIMSTSLMFNSGDVHNIPITPFSHLTTGLMLYLSDGLTEDIDEEFIKLAYQKIGEIYSIIVNDPNLSISLEENSNELILEGDKKYGLLVSALAQIAFEESLEKEDALKSLYNLSSLNNLMYEDIRSDGILNGKSFYENEGGVKTLAFGNQIIDTNFYRLKIAFAMQKSLDQISTTESSYIKEQEDYILLVAQSESTLFSEINNEALNEIVPEINLMTSLADIEKEELVLEFKVEKAFKIANIKLQIDEIEYDYEPDSIYIPSTGLYSFAFSTTFFKDGPHQLSIIVSDTFNNIGNIQIPVTFDNTPPDLTISSASLTNSRKFLLQGTFNDSFSKVKSITVDGDQAVILNDNRWEKLVTLSNGRNGFLIGIEDGLGNYTEILTNVSFDESAPIVTITSPTLTNNSQFKLNGEYIDEQSNIIGITVNGYDATINMLDEKWSISLELVSGSNKFLITIEDDAGNVSEFSTHVILDDLAPSIAMSSSLITNSKQYTLKGGYDETQSGVSRISVNGDDATIFDDGSWSKPVVLSSGTNEFAIRIEDHAGNFREISSKVILYEDTPVVTLSSNEFANTAEYILEGDYEDGGFGINYFVVNDEDVNIVAKNKWSKAVSLKSGLNSFIVRIEDKAGNLTEFETEVILDNLAPLIKYADPGNVRFSNNDGSYFSNSLELENDVPLFIELNKLSLSGMEASKANLIAEKIPYFAFDIKDQSLEGVKTNKENLLVEYRYLISDFEIIPWQTKSLQSDSSELLLPLVAETLSNAWYKANPDDLHKLQIRATDNVGNVEIKQTTFKTQFYVPSLNLQVNSELDSISNGDFSTRSNYIDREVLAVNYNLNNFLDRSFKIRIDDDSLHSVIQQFDEVQRVNKMEKHSKEVWRKGKIKDLDKNKCPSVEGSTNVSDWREIKKLWNFVNDSWEEKVPRLDIEIISFSEDMPVPDLPTEWFNYNSADSDVDFFRIRKGTRYTLSYEFDYILDYIEGEEPLPRDNNPGALQAVILFKEGVLVPCPTNINAIKTRTEYDYIPIDENKDGVPDYPKNNMNLKVKDAIFSSSNFAIFAEDGAEIVAQSGWFEVPANQTVTIKKYVKTPSLNLYTDNAVANPETIKDYKMHRLDRKLKWTISQNLIVDTQFNPDDILLDSLENIKQQVFQLEDKVEVFQRN